MTRFADANAGAVSFCGDAWRRRLQAWNLTPCLRFSGGMLSRVSVTERKLFASEFDERTAANMEVALERACQRLPANRQDHDTRKLIAERIVDAARKGRTTLGELTAAGVEGLKQLP